MLYRENSKNGDKISILGYGGMRFPTRGGRIDEKKAREQLIGAIESGVNYIDTAYPYHNGASESFIGNVLKEGYRDRVKIATKLPPWSVNVGEDMTRIFNDQLKKLQVECIDYYLLHALNKDSWEKMKKLNVLEFLDNLKVEGKVKNVGFSFHGDKGTFKHIVDAYDWDMCQIQYNFLDVNVQAGREGLKYAAAKGLSVFVMEPLRGGKLVDPLPKAVKALYDDSGFDRSPAEWALRWIWNQPEVTCVLSGMNTDEHIEENIRVAADTHPNAMSPGEGILLEKAKDVYDQLMRIPCTSCEYCMPCPFGVDIPRCFELYNTRHLLKQNEMKFFYWFQLGGITDRESYASLCKNCGKCLENCPQSIDIPTRLDEVAKDMEGLFMKPGVKVMKGVFSVQSKLKRNKK